VIERLGRRFSAVSLTAKDTSLRDWTAEGGCPHMKKGD
jgi:hypothetical protein